MAAARRSRRETVKPRRFQLRGPAVEAWNIEKKTSYELFRRVPPIVLTLRSFPDGKMMHLLRTTTSIAKIYVDSMRTAVEKAAAATVVEKRLFAIAAQEGCVLSRARVQEIMGRFSGDWRQVIGDLETYCAAKKTYDKLGGADDDDGNSQRNCSVAVAPSSVLACTARAFWQHLHVLHRFNGSAVLMNNGPGKRHTPLLLKGFREAEAYSACLHARKAVSALRVHDVTKMLMAYAEKLKWRLFECSTFQELQVLQATCLSATSQCLVPEDGTAVQTMLTAHFLQMKGLLDSGGLMQYYCDTVLPDLDAAKRYIGLEETVEVNDMLARYRSGGYVLCDRTFSGDALHPSDAAVVQSLLAQHWPHLTSRHYYTETFLPLKEHIVRERRFWAWNGPRLQQPQHGICMEPEFHDTDSTSASFTVSRGARFKTSTTVDAKDIVYSTPFDMVKLVLNKHLDVVWDSTSTLAERLLWQNAYADFATHSIESALDIAECWSQGDSSKFYGYGGTTIFADAMRHVTQHVIVFTRMDEGTPIIQQHSLLSETGTASVGNERVNSHHALRELRHGCIETAMHTRKHMVDAFQLMRLRKAELERRFGTGECSAASSRRQQPDLMYDYTEQQLACLRKTELQEEFSWLAAAAAAAATTQSSRQRQPVDVNARCLLLTSSLPLKIEAPRPSLTISELIIQPSRVSEQAHERVRGAVQQWSGS